tara:strand:- start:463 stop:591 length:129 start_codon:yes stop_codon:yes gene_type:complete
MIKIKDKFVMMKIRYGRKYIDTLDDWKKAEIIFKIINKKRKY